MTRRPSFATPPWSVFRKGTDIVVVPRVPLLIRLRSMIPDTYFSQPALTPLKRFMDAIFIAGPACIIVALYLPRGSGLLVWLGIVCLAIASLYWFAPHFLCRLYLARRGYAISGGVDAADYEAALAQGRSA